MTGPTGNSALHCLVHITVLVLTCRNYLLCLFWPGSEFAGSAFELALVFHALFHILPTLYSNTLGALILPIISIVLPDSTCQVTSY